MLALIKVKDGFGGAKVDGFIIATDIPDLRKKAQMAGEREIAAALAGVDVQPSPGTYPLGMGYTLCVQRPMPDG